jgi:hypothetical protein
MAAENPAVFAVYAERAKLLDTKEWKQFQRLAKCSQVVTRQLNQAKLASYRTAPLFKFAYQVPRHYKEAITLDERNGNTKYRDAENGLQVHAANVGNAYLELEGHTLVVLHKALYCLRSSGQPSLQLLPWLTLMSGCARTVISMSTA